MRWNSQRNSRMRRSSGLSATTSTRLHVERIMASLTSSRPTREVRAVRSMSLLKARRSRISTGAVLWLRPTIASCIVLLMAAPYRACIRSRSLIKAVEPTEVLRAEERYEDADEAHNGQIRCFLSSPSRNEPVVNQQKVNEPGEKRKQQPRISRPEAPDLLGPERARYDAERYERKPDGQRFVCKVVTYLERWQPVVKARGVLGFQLPFLDQIHDRRCKRDEQRGISDEDHRYMDVDPVAAEHGRNRAGWVVCKIGDERHYEKERERENAERRDTVLRVSDQKSQDSQCPEERKSFIPLGDRQVLHLHGAKDDRRHVTPKTRNDRYKGRPEKGLPFVQSGENRMQKTHEIQTQCESQQDDVHGGGL